jgi:predicted DCC family thiol-disulfide oxidoreductase YuxK
MNILFFDGVCHLCNSYINFLVRWNSKKVMFFSALQGQKALELLTEAQRVDLESILYYKNGKVLEKSSAVMESLADTNPCFGIVKIFYVIPAFIRNAFYDLVAKNRYKLFGKSDLCRIPTAEERKYILD